MRAGLDPRRIAPCLKSWNTMKPRTMSSPAMTPAAERTIHGQGCAARQMAPPNSDRVDRRCHQLNNRFSSAYSFEALISSLSERIGDPSTAIENPSVRRSPTLAWTDLASTGLIASRGRASPTRALTNVPKVGHVVEPSYGRNQSEQENSALAQFSAPELPSRHWLAMASVPTDPREA